MPNELYHHGVKGQKWGVRRYQNSDGTLTSAGKKRYNKGDGDKKKSGKSNVKKYVKAGAVAAGVLLSAYGTYKLSKSQAFSKAVSVGKKHVEALAKDYKSILKKNAPKQVPMSDDELVAKIKRLQLEKTYKSLTNKKRQSKILGKAKIVNDYINTGLNLYRNIDTSMRLLKDRQKKAI